MSHEFFVNEHDFTSNLDKQMSMAARTIEQLRGLKVTEDETLKLEYFFYTNTAKKAEQLVAEIKKLNYSVEYGVAAADQKLFIVTGWTTKMKMVDEIVEQWIKKMCELGYKYDCEFDGWGTHPDQ